MQGAIVTLTDKETNRTQTTTTDAAGVYSFLSLPPSDYTITVEKQGFKQQTLEDVTVNAEQTQAVNITLQIGAVQQSVTVSAPLVPLIDTETGQIGMTLTNNEIQELPNLGRDPYKLLGLTPGVFGNSSFTNGGGSVLTPGNAGVPGAGSLTTSIFGTENQPQINAGGQRVTTNNYQIDGVEVNSLDWNGAAIITPSEESIQEIRVTSNDYDATLGRGSGAQVEVVSKRGTNSFHGSAFFKMDRPGLNAYQAYNGPAGAAADQRVPDRFNQFGGSVGGPIIHNKLFAFFAYETLRNSTASTGTGWVETSDYLTATAMETGYVAGTLASFPGENASFVKVLPGTCATAGMGALPAQCQDVSGGINVGSFLTGSVKGSLDPSYGQPTTPYGIGNGLTTTPDFQFVEFASPVTQVGDQYNGRLDYQIDPSDLLSYSIYWVPNTTTFYNGAQRAADLWHSDRLNYSQTVLWNHTFSPTLLNEARFNVSRWWFNELDSNPQEPWGLPLDFLNCVGGACDQAFGSQGPGIFYKTNYNIRDTATKSLGNHLIRFGTDLYFEQNKETLSGAGRPDYVFRNLWEFANDAPVTEFGDFNPSTGVPTNATGYLRDNIWALYIQDDYKLRPNLTINMGLRWEYFTPIHEKYNHIGFPILGADPNELADLTMQIGGNIYNANAHNFGPQVGFAWSPSLLHGKTVVRGGFGIGYDRTEDAVPDNFLDNVPFHSFFVFQGASAPEIVYAVPSDPHQFNNWPANPNAVLTFDPVTHLPTSGAPVTVYGIQKNLPTPRTYRYSLETQTELGHSWVATIGYQGSKSSFYPRETNANWEYTPVNPAVNNVMFWTDDVHGNYNALLTELDHHFGDRYSLDFQYTYSKSLDTATSDFSNGIGDYEFFGGVYNYGPSDFDATHNVKVWAEWEPKLFRNDDNWMKKAIEGWKLAPIWNFHSGFPWTPEYNVIFSGLSNTCSLVYLGSGYCTIRPAAYLGGAGRNYGNVAIESGPTPSSPSEPNVNFPKGAPAYFTPPVLTNSVSSGIPPAPGVGRNSFRGPRYNDVDFTIAKAFALPNTRVLGENAAIELRGYIYNLFNSVNLTPLGNQTIGNLLVSSSGMETVTPNPNFGQAQSALAGRVVELEARFSF